jgi:hypothetical protein
VDEFDSRSCPAEEAVGIKLTKNNNYSPRSKAIAELYCTVHMKQADVFISRLDELKGAEKRGCG